jgi:tetratricopeptide (TPR) repeat protein
VKKVQSSYAEVFKYKRLEWTLAALYRQGYVLERFGATINETPVPPEVRRLGNEAVAAYQDLLQQQTAALEDKAVESYAATLEQARKNRISNEWTKKTLEALNRYRPKEYPVLKDPKPAIAVDVTWPDGLVSAAVPKEKAEDRPAKEVQPARAEARGPRPGRARSHRSPGRRRRLVRRLLLPLLALGALGACGHAPVAAPPPRPLTTSTAATPEVQEGPAKGQGGPVDADTQAAIDRGIAQGRSGDLDGARRTFQDVVHRNPNAGAAWVNLGVIAERRGDLAEAEASYRRAAQTTPSHPSRGTSWPGSWSDQAGRRGRGAARGRVQEAPTALGARNALTWVLLETKRLPEAEAESKKVLKADEQNVRAMQLLAQGYYRQGKYELCRLILENARAVDPKDPVTHNALGTVLLKLKQRPAALESFKTAASLRPDFAEAHSNFGAMLVESGDYDGAVKELELAVSAAPELLPARMNLGNAYRGKLELAKAKEQYEKVVALDPTLADTYYNLAILHLDSDVPGMDTIDRYNKAIAYFTTYKEKGGSDDRVEQYLKDAAKGIDREQRRREREKKDQLRKAEKEAEAKKQAEAEAPAASAEAAPPPRRLLPPPPPSPNHRRARRRALAVS